MAAILSLTYHNVIADDRKPKLFDVRLAAFKEQLAYVNESSRGRKSQSIVLTFDDGYRSWAADVLDLLLQCRIRAYFFVCVQHIKEGFITEEDILKLKKHGMIIGSHSLKHSFLPLLDDAAMHVELSQSKRVLERIIGDQVKYFSVPRGIYDGRVMKMAKQLGYKTVFTSDIGLNVENNFIIKRISIKRDTALEYFKGIVSGRNIAGLQRKQWLKDSAKGLLGLRVYNRLRSMVIPGAE